MEKNSNSGAAIIIIILIIMSNIWGRVSVRDKMQTQIDSLQEELEYVQETEADTSLTDALDEMYCQNEDLRDEVFEAEELAGNFVRYFDEHKVDSKEAAELFDASETLRDKIYSIESGLQDISALIEDAE